MSEVLNQGTDQNAAEQTLVDRAVVDEVEALTLNPGLDSFGPGPADGAFISLSSQLEAVLFEDGEDHLQEPVWVFVDDLAETVHRLPAGSVETHAVTVPVSKEFEEIAGRVLPVFDGPFEDEPHVAPERRFVAGETGVPVDSGNGLIHSGSDFEIWINRQHELAQVGNEVLERVEENRFVLLTVGLEPRLVVVPTQIPEKIDGLGTEAVEWHNLTRLIRPYCNNKLATLEHFVKSGLQSEKSGRSDSVSA